MLQQLLDHGFIAILRRVPSERAEPVAQALLNAGIRALEFTFDHTEDNCVAATHEKIARVKRAFGDALVLGAGTVLTEEEVDAARDAGAALIISPDTNRAVIERTKRQGMLSLPGALTPTEIVSAHRWGADVIKVFPAGEMGLAYFKALMGPLKHIPMAAVGGITPDNLADFWAAGACCFGVSSAMVPAVAVRSGDYRAIERAAARFVAALREAKR